MTSLAAGEVAAQHGAGETPAEWFDPASHAAGALEPIAPADSSSAGWGSAVRESVGGGLNPMRYLSP
jgi:hypothetical protein